LLAQGADCCSTSRHPPKALLTRPAMTPKRAAGAKVDLSEVQAASLVKPKAKAKGKGKAKAKGKGKAKAKGKGKSKAKAKSVPKVAEDATADTEVAVDEEGVGLLPIDGSTEKPKAKAKSKALGMLRKRVLEALNGKSAQDGMAEAKQELAKVEAQLQEAVALEEAHRAQAEAAVKEFDEIQAMMNEAIDKESEAAHKYRQMSDQRAEASHKEMDRRQQLLEEQKTLNMLEVMALEHKKMEELELKKKEATETAEAAKRNLAEQKQRERDALEATKKALEDARNMGRGGKRRAQ